MQEPQPSPYFNRHDHHQHPSDDDKEFLQEIDAVCAEFGIKHYFVAFKDEKDLGPDITQWKSFSNTLDEAMVKYLEMIMKAMRVTWEEVKKKKLL